MGPVSSAPTVAASSGGSPWWRRPAPTTPMPRICARIDRTSRSAGGTGAVPAAGRAARCDTHGRGVGRPRAPWVAAHPGRPVAAPYRRTLPDCSDTAAVDAIERRAVSWMTWTMEVIHTRSDVARKSHGDWTFHATMRYRALRAVRLRTVPILVPRP